MKSLRKRKIAKSLSVKVKWCKGKDGSTYVFMRGKYGGSVHFINPNETFCDEAYLKSLKTINQQSNMSDAKSAQ